MKKVKLDDFELRVIIKSLNETRTKLISEGEDDTHLVDDIIIKCLDVLQK